MTPEKDKLLVKKYPKIFQDRHGSPLTTCMAWGFECGDGWFDLIDTLCSCIQNHVDRQESLNKTYPTEERECHQVVAAQVKEKFGGLRFYVNGGDNEIEGMIQFAESMSYKICEQCGNKGTRKGQRWIFTMCDNCWEEHEKAKNT